MIGRTKRTGDVTRNREDIASELARLEARLSALDAERVALREQITAGRRHLAAVEAVTISVPKLQPSSTPTPTTHPAKVALFASLFRGREDVYPRFWTNEKRRTKGWAPACSNEWKRPLCQKPTVKCGECPHQAFGPVTPQIIQDHLQGHHVIGVTRAVSARRAGAGCACVHRSTPITDSGACRSPIPVEADH